MPLEQIIMYIIGVMFIIMGITKVTFNGRRAQRLIRLIGVVGVQIFYIVLGIAFIIINYLLG